MNFATTLTQKGQVTIPKNIREILNLRIGDKISLELVNKDKNEIRIKSLPKLEDLAGSFKVKKPKDPVKLRQYMETHYKRV